MFNVKRREFLTLAAGATIARPHAARAQQRSIPVIGYLNGGSPLAMTLEAFRQGLGESGYVEGQNVAIEYHWAEGKYDRLSDLAAELVGRHVDVIVADGGDLAARAAKVATSTIPVVFTSGDDPVETGLVTSLARPSGNLTRVCFFVVELHAKRIELLSELVPQAKLIALLANPLSPQTERVLRALQLDTTAKGVELPVLNASTESAI